MRITEETTLGELEAWLDETQVRLELSRRRGELKYTVRLLSKLSVHPEREVIEEGNEIAPLIRRAFARLERLEHMTLAERLNKAEYCARRSRAGE